MNKYNLKSIHFDFSTLTEEEKYVKDIPSFKDISELEINNKITYFVGENGSGKSTLIEAIATRFGFNKEGGTIHSNYQTNNTDNLKSDWIQLSWQPLRYKSGFFFRAESMYNFSNYVGKMEDEGGLIPYGGDNLHCMSHGEQFMKIMESRMDIIGLYIIDEIESALSPINQLKLVEIIKYMRDQGSQFIIATHSPIILSIQDTEILSFDSLGINKIEYDFVSCVDIYKRVLNKK